MLTRRIRDCDCSAFRGRARSDAVDDLVYNLQKVHLLQHYQSCDLLTIYGGDSDTCRVSFSEVKSGGEVEWWCGRVTIGACNNRGQIYGAQLMLSDISYTSILEDN